MKLTITTFIALSLVFMTIGCSRDISYAVEPFSVKVVDSKGMPVGNVLVIASYQTRKGTHGVLSGVVHFSKVRTNCDGIAAFPGWSKDGVSQGFNEREPTIVAYKFGYEADSDRGRSDRSTGEGRVSVKNIRLRHSEHLTLNSCPEAEGPDRAGCIADAFSFFSAEVGPIAASLDDLPEVKKEYERVEKYASQFSL